MMSKDCQTDRRPLTAWLTTAAFVLLASPGLAADELQTVRLWSKAVVTGEQVLLGDLCELSGFQSEAHERVRESIVDVAPPPGGTSIITLDDVRKAVTEAGMNPAWTLLKGAAECRVSRPRMLETQASLAAATSAVPRATSKPVAHTLRAAVVRHFEEELARYGGTVTVDFSPRNAAVLDLGGPEFSFEVRRRTARLVGLINIEVDVRRGGEVVQTARLQPVVTLRRNVVVAARSINQKAPIRAADVRLVEMSFDSLDRLGVTEINRVVGQRAKSFISEGTLVEMRDVEERPLVKRGQLVDVVSRAGGITVVTSAKSLSDGCLGDSVDLRAGGRRGRHIMGRVIGPRRVELSEAALALGDVNASDAWGGR